MLFLLLSHDIQYLRRFRPSADSPLPHSSLLLPRRPLGHPLHRTILYPHLFCVRKLDAQPAGGVSYIHLPLRSYHSPVPSTLRFGRNNTPPRTTAQLFNDLL